MQATMGLCSVQSKGGLAGRATHPTPCGEEACATLGPTARGDHGGVASPAAAEMATTLWPGAGGASLIGPDAEEGREKDGNNNGCVP